MSRMVKIKNRYSAVIGCLMVCITAMTATISSAESIPAQDVQVTTPVYRPSLTEYSPELGTFEYEVSWQGIPAAAATIIVEHEGDKFKVTTKARTYSPIDLLYDLKYTAEGTLNANDLSPIRTIITQKENSKKKKTDIAFLGNGEISALREQNGEEPISLRFNSNNFTLDPVSAAFLARGLPWKVGDTRDFDTFNGKSRYLITLTAIDKIQMDVNGVEKSVFVIRPTVKNLTNPDANKKLREAKIYVTDDKDREILKIASEVFIGTVTTKLISFTPNRSTVADAPGTTTVAQRTDVDEDGEPKAQPRL